MLEIRGVVNLFLKINTIFAFCFLLLSAENVEKIDFKGLSYMSKELAQDISNIKVGDALNLKKVDDSINTFYNQGYFSDIYATFKNSTLTFYFKERPAVASIEIKGYGTQSEKDTLYEQIAIKKGDAFSSSKLDKGVETLKQVLSYKGYYGSVVEPELKYLNNNRAVSITLNVNRGDSIKIEKSYYFGSKSLKHRKIESLSANKQADTLGFLWGLNDGKLMLNELELDNLRIQDVYRRNGFLDADISKPLLKIDFNSKKASLFYHIKEGVQYHVKGIEFVISDEDKNKISDADLRKGLTTNVGTILDIQTLRDDAEILKVKMANLGYAYAVATPDVKQNRAKQEAIVIYHLNYGKKVKINDVIVSGNSKTWDRVIRREILIAPGEEYSLSKIKSSENALNRIGYFEKATIEEKRISSDLMDLVVKVKEGRTGDLSFGFGYGSFYGVMLNANVNERNLFGSGFTASLYGNISFGGTIQGLNTQYARLLTQQVLNFTVTNPRVLDSSWSLSTNIYYSQYLNYVYSQQTTGGGFTFGRLITPTLRFTIGYDINKTNTFGFYDIYGNPTPQYQKYFTASNNGGIWKRDYQDKNAPYKSSVTPGLSFDNTDDYYFPKNGISSSISAEFAGLGGDVKYTKLYSKLALYYDLSKLIKVDLIARYKVQGGYIFRYNKNDFLSLNDTYYMGGVGTVRGYTSYSISPTDADMLRVGGDGIFTNSLELSYGLVPSAKLRIALYADYGILTYHGSNGSANFINYGTSASPTSYLVRGAAGASIEWVSPMGPIVFVIPFLWYGPDVNGQMSIFSYNGAAKVRNVNNYLSNYPSYFEFTMGTRF